MLRDERQGLGDLRDAAAANGHGRTRQHRFLTGLSLTRTRRCASRASSRRSPLGGKVKLAQIVSNIDSASLAPPAVESLLASKGSTLNGMLSTDYYPSIAAASIVTSDPQFRHVLFIGQDNNPTVMNAIANHDIYGTMYQNDYGQADVAITWLDNILAKGCTVSPNGPLPPFPDRPATSSTPAIARVAGQHQPVHQQAGEHPLEYGPGPGGDFQVPELPVVGRSARGRGGRV